jgi:hypothetical protein
MDFEEAQDMYYLYMIDPQMTCTCDEVHTCQQCMEDNDQHDDYDDDLPF